MNISVQYAIEKLLEQFFYNLPADTAQYISIVATIAIVGALFSLFIGLFTQRKNSAKIVIIIIIIAVSAVFVLGQYFDLKLVFENALSSVTGG